MKARAILLSIVLAGTTVTIPAVIPAFAAGNTMKAASNPGEYSDRDRMRSSADEKKQLEQALKTGEEKDFYRRELEKMGWQITAVNYDKPDYLEYEIVKGPSTYEVQVSLDKNNHRANKVDVTWNMWKADFTERALKGEKVAYPNRTTVNANRYSDRDMMKSSKNEKDRLEKVLKPGQDAGFYRRELEKMGWQITSVNYDKPDYVEWEIVKRNSTYEVQMDLDKSNHKVNKFDVTSNIWKADATKQALKQNETHAQR